MKLNQVTVGCSDYAASVDFYRALGLAQIVDAPPRYARFETSSGETFSIHQVEAVAVGSTTIYFECNDLDGKIAQLRAIGIVMDSGPRDERWGWREARLRDPGGNVICLYRAGEYRRFPPWRTVAAPDFRAKQS
ncbi:VOC family protein [Novosphingopyxis sp.]|uniref:VOC family protein n=1 Tax=Novosphingopyxis sp. TaxID=2709690 RepID=UPI003B5A41E9